jgi:LmbE family N-acetylglucosaminyl deacetylase
MKNYVLPLVVFLAAFHLNAQENRLGNSPISSSEIYHNIEKLGFLGSALFVAAHPDDENTRLISWLDNEKMARTAYLSLTRGDGGQNLIGPELREQLGIIRTQELLEARNIDGGEQFFTRANDFGYSKDPEETLDIWDREQVLADIVRIIRKFQPDIIVNRFDHRTAGTTHGHHTSSAILSVEAFDLASDATKFPEQLDQLSTWQPERLFFNTSWWFYGSRDAFAKADKTNLYEVDSGTYFTSTGYSNGEIAALSRSQHQSQGFGSSGSRGNATEYLEYLKGSRPADKSDPFAGINTTWSRIDNSGNLQKQWQRLLDDYDFKDPSASIDQLLRMKTAMDQLPESYWKTQKLKEVNQIVQDVLGLYLKAYTSQRFATPGDVVPVYLEVVNRATNSIEFTFQADSRFQYESQSPEFGLNEGNTYELQLTVPDNHIPTTPYYLKETGDLGMYVVNDPNLIGIPELDAEFKIEVRLKNPEKNVIFDVPVVYRATDRVRGEIYEPFTVRPAVSIAFDQPNYIVTGFERPTQVTATVTAFKDIEDFAISASAMESWKITVADSDLSPMQAGSSRQFTFNVLPTAGTEADLELSFSTNDKRYRQQVVNVAYDHIPDQQYLKPAISRMVALDLRNAAQTVAYINGAGDDVATAIESIGSKVFRYDPADVPNDLSKYDAVMVGIRAYNVAPQEMAQLQSRLDSYVENGGTLIMQYNTNRGISKDALGPLEITLSRKRVTDETAAVEFLDTNNKMLNTPNKITQQDFEGWVQERGLYFPEAWDPAFQPILGMSDKGEEQTTGSLIVAEYGDGHVVYTGLSLFRELPAGVAGAYKLLANMLSLSTDPPKINSDADEKF